MRRTGKPFIVTGFDLRYGGLRSAKAGENTRLKARELTLAFRRREHRTLLKELGEREMERGTTDPGMKNKALEMAISSIEKQFGKGSIMRLGTGDSLYKNVEAISTGSLSLDMALGIGGIPRGRIVEIFGPESSGKTTLTLHALAEMQKTGGTAAFVDAEHALDTEYAKKLGVDIDNLLISQPDTGEQALEIVDTLVRSGAVDLLVVDSVAALTPRAEIEGDMGDSHMGLQARLMSQALRKLTGTISKSNCTVIFINQIRMKIGVMFGNPETTTGGNALKFYSSVRMDIRRIGAIKNGDQILGNRTRVKVVKNKMAAPFRQVEFDIMYGQGISREGDLLDLAVNDSIVDKAGAWFSFQGERIGQGRENAKVWLKEHPEQAEKIKTLIMEKAGLLKTDSPESSEDAAENPEDAAASTPARKVAKAAGRGRPAKNLQ
jgi:recombination protein RecA